MKKYSKNKQPLEISQNIAKGKKEQSISPKRLLIPLNLSTEEALRQVKQFLKEESEEEENKEELSEEDLALFWYLYNSEQINDLTREDKKRINQWVRKRLKEDPNAEVWEIDEDE